MLYKCMRGQNAACVCVYVPDPNAEIFFLISFLFRQQFSARQILFNFRIKFEKITVFGNKSQGKANPVPYLISDKKCCHI